MIIKRQREFSFISNGLRWIKEIKKIDPLPISKEDYSIFLFHKKGSKLIDILSEVKFQFEKTEELEKILAKYYNFQDAPRILRKIGLGLFWSFSPAFFKSSERIKGKNIIYGKDKLFTAGIDFSYDRINHIPKRYLFDSIGVGGTGIVFDYPFKKYSVEKITFSDFGETELKFYKYLIKHPVSIFPRIYDVSKDQVIEEKLITESPKIDLYRKWIKEYVYKSSIFNPWRVIDWDRVNKDFPSGHEFILFLNSVEEGLGRILGKKCVGDLHGKNIGERIGTGEIVYFDPIPGG